jgi:hypothetical protein
MCIARKQEAKALNMSLHTWHMCLNNYGIACGIIGCKVVTPMIIFNHQVTMARIADQLQHRKCSYKHVLLVSLL